MTRDKEIRKEAIEVTHLAQFGHSGRDMAVAYDAFILGAQWADKTMRDKILMWLDSIDFDMKYWNPEEGVCVGDFIEDFRKVMEG